MGCLTGNYLLMKGDLKIGRYCRTDAGTIPLVADFEGEVPGAALKIAVTTCSMTYLAAKWGRPICKEVLEHMKDNLYYPTKE